METKPRYPIGAVSQRTGLSTHVIRAWERRYDVVRPVRAPGGARLYSAADLLRLRLLRQATESGFSIGTIADLPLAELMGLSGAADTDVEAAPVERADGGAPSFEAPILLAIEAMDVRGIQTGLRRALAYHGAREFVGQVAVPLLRRVGELWEDATLCPAQEHLFSVQLRRELQHLLDSLHGSKEAPTLVATTLSGESHEMGAMLAAVVAASEGWRVIYTGPDLPPEDVAMTARVTGAAVVAVSVVSPVTRRTLALQLHRLTELLPDEVAVVLGGAGAATHANAIEAAGSTHLPDLDALAAELRRLTVGGPAASLSGAGAAP